MSKHRMPPGAGRKDDPTAEEVMDAESTAVELTESSEGAEPKSEEAEVEKPEEPESGEFAETTAVDTQDTQTGTVEDTEAVEETKPAEEPTPADEPTPAGEERPERRINWLRVAAFGVLPGLALILVMAAGYLKWWDNSVHTADKAREEAMQTAKDSTVRMLSYKPDTVDQDLNGARDLLTGDFRDQYTSLINDVVIPGAKQKQISAVATVPAMGAVSADPNEAVVLLFVNQTVVVGQDPPTDTASSVRVTLEKVGDRWLISKFDPV